MTIEQHIADLISSQPEPKRTDMQTLHQRILQVLPGCRLWYDSGVDETGKVVTNPTIGYGFQVLQYAGGKTKDFFQIGVSGNTTGISVYILGLKDKKYLAETYSKKIGKASVTGYCIKFKKLAEIDLRVLIEAVQYSVAATAPDR